MEAIRGRTTREIDAEQLRQVARQYKSVLLDIGTGDGRFIQRQAEVLPERFFIGLDACRENLQTVSRKAPSNTGFIIANALDLPDELHDLATHISINFPWGSLLRGLLTGDENLLSGLANIARSDAHLELRLNAGALAEEGWPLDDGTLRIGRTLNESGFSMKPAVWMEKAELMACPTTWSKRLAFGRDPRARLMEGTKINEVQ